MHEYICNKKDANIINQCLMGNPGANNVFSVFWRFMPQTWTPVLPPWGFPDKIELTGVSTNQSGLDFYGVEIGDVVSTYANPANFGGSAPGFVLRVEDRLLQAGDQLAVLFSADAFNDLAAWQFALHFDSEKLQFDSLETLAGLPLTADNFGLFNCIFPKRCKRMTRGGRQFNCCKTARTRLSAKRRLVLYCPKAAKRNCGFTMRQGVC